MIQKPPRKIEIYTISVQQMDLPEFEMDVHCSGGTYIRSLAYDIGRKLNCGAHLSGLCRTRSSAFDLNAAIELSDLEKMAPQEIEPYILPMSDCLAFLPSIRADRFLEKKISYGQKLGSHEISPLLAADFVSAPFVKVVDTSDRLLALIEPDKEGLLYNYCCVFTG